METKLSQQRMSKARRSCGFIHGIDVDAEGSRGGLCLGWKPGIDVNLKSFSKWHIDVMVKEDSSQIEWRFTDFYGTPYSREQSQVWELLKSLSQNVTGPWLVAGDFNEIMYSFEKKKKGIPRDQRRMELFRETLAGCKLSDIGFSGVSFTWERGNLPKTNIRERLDRGVANDEWISLFPLGRVHATTHRRANFITKLVADDGKEIVKETELQEAAKIFFEKLFSSDGVADPKRILEGVDSCISPEMNEVLNSPFTADEILVALKGMGPLKAPGSDGFPALFFQKYWQIVGKDVLDFCLGVLNDGKEVVSANSTDIMLIPKTSHPTTLVNFRPISLCTVLYKLVTKTIANRMQDVMGICIDKAQSAFVPGRLISDNILLAYELLHTFRQKRMGKKGYMVVKLDMSKAYDRVEWDFVKQMMKKLGFESRWIELIMKCITTVSYAVVINGNRGGNFQPTMGLSQGDPLSPFLFLICSEGLSALMRLAMRNGLVRGAKACRRGPEISHLLFADDCILFGEATEEGANVVKDILKEYECCSGKYVNFNKSNIFYSTNTREEMKDLVSNLLGVSSSSSPEKYLGLPSIVGQRKTEAFGNLVDRVAVRIDAWSSRLLSQEGKEVFIKSVLQAIPTYAMSCFLFPNSLCDKIESKLAHFWWQKGAGKRGIHWCKWQSLCRPKEEGGVRFRSMAQFNISLLAKQGWRFFNSPDTLVSQVFKAKYFPDCHFLDSQLGNSGSYVWKSIWATKATLEKGAIWKVVEALIDSNSREWKRELVVDTFQAEVADLILRIPLADEAHEDFLAWNAEPSGEYTVKSSYKLLQRLNPTAYALQTVYKDFYKKIWRLDIPTKVKIFIWRVSWNYLATLVNLMARRLAMSSMCPRCGVGHETMIHLFRDCSVSKEVWMFLSDLDMADYPQEEFVVWLTRKVLFFSLTKCRVFCVALWAIWGERNTRIHEKKCRSGRETANFVLDYCAVSGIVARDSSGRVLLSSTKIHGEVESAFAAEAIACRHAVQIALAMEQTYFVIKGDSLTTIKKCKQRSERRQCSGTRLRAEMRRKKKGQEIEATDLKEKLRPLVSVYTFNAEWTDGIAR
ncbi:reverse transcriptase [Gossypium australe]|uniref:Reverse transcriptase n=1 Tax=Gossypium australe TaxID=47621 RepID=A0A5B6WW96_9ROSI|nr:reverse transcriptase [Gossypium australe]